MSSGLPINFEHVDRVVKPEDLPEGYLHVVVFGPGQGEAIILRTPDGRVGLIDGCKGPVDEASRRGSPVFDLLKQLGVDRLLFACLTHPHQDHFLGFPELIDIHKPEHLWWPGSHERGFFQHYLDYIIKTRCEVRESSATDEPLVKNLGPLVAAIGKLADDPPKDLIPRPRTQTLSDWKLLLRRSIKDNASVEINSVLPSSSAIRMAEQDVLHALTKNTLGASRPVDPNRISAALLVSWGQTKVLLGGDALCAGDDSFQGWKGLQFSLGKVNVVKVPHHASAGAYAKALWDEMQPDLAIVTCVKKASADQPPRPDMLKTLIGHCSALALTSCPTWWTSEPHAIVAEPHPWPLPTARATGALTGALATIKAKPASAENKHQNAVVVRLDADGNILRVALHGDARKLSF